MSDSNIDDVRTRIAVPRDAQGNEKKFVLTVTRDGVKEKLPVDNETLKALFKDWYMAIPGVAVREPMGWLIFDEGISPREEAIVSNAMNAYVKAGRLNLEWNDDTPDGGEYIEPDYAEDKGPV